MFDFGAGELLVIGIVALVVIGPKELPGVLRQVGKATGKMRQMAGEFRSQFDEAMREADLQDATKHLAGFKDDVISTATRLNPLTEIRNEIHSSTAMLNAPLSPVEREAHVEATLPTIAPVAKPKRVRKGVGVASVESAEPKTASRMKTNKPAKAGPVMSDPPSQEVGPSVLSVSKPDAEKKVPGKTVILKSDSSRTKIQKSSVSPKTPAKLTLVPSSETPAQAQKPGGRIVALKTPPKAG